MTREEVIKLMKSSESEAEWNENCDKVREACGGWPAFWWSTIIGSGLASDIATKWGGDAGIHVTAYTS